MRFTSFARPRFLTLLLAGACALTLSACSGSDETLERDLQAPSRADIMAPPMAPDPAMMDPEMKIARSKGLKTNVYFNEELQQTVARLQGMEETLGRLQSDLQGTAMAMQRVEMMRQEIEALNIKIQGLQERVLYAGPMLGVQPPAPVAAPTMDGEHIADTVAGPEADPVKPVSGQISKPVVDDAPKAAKSAPAPTGNGVAGVRIGAHPDRVRIVLDVNGSKTDFSANVDEAEKVLTVELPGTAWSAAKTETYKGNPLVDSYMAQGQGKGTVVAFSLKGDTKILDKKVIKSADGKPSRILIDLSK